MLIDCHRPSDKWRMDRLNKAVKTFCRIYGISKNQADLLIVSVRDHKGFLEVTWVGEVDPTPEQERAFGIAWEVCGEPSENVRHNVPI